MKKSDQVVTEGRNIGGGYIPPVNKLKQYKRLDPIEFDILSYRLYSIINEGRQATMRVSGSPVVAEGGEALFAIYDPYGATSSLACGLLLHMIGTEGFIREILELQSESPGIFDGDMFMYNEPLIGGIHACDQWTGTPIYHKGELICWLGALTHTAETGAIEPGGMPPSARSLLHEGYRVQGIKIQERGKINRAALNCVLRSTRDPAYYTLDLRARIAGVNVAKERINELIARYGVDKVKVVIQQNMDYSEALARSKLKKLADGTWRSVNFGDWDIGPNPKLWKVFLTAKKSGDELSLDFNGSSDANEGPSNCMINGTWGSIFVAIASLLFWEIPGNAGVVRPLRLVAPEGSLVNVPFLTPCSVCPSRPGMLISNVVTTIISKMLYTNKTLWEDINAPWVMENWGGTIWGGKTQYGYESAGMFGESWAKGTGAGIDCGRGDGCDSGGAQMTTESCIADVEMNELRYPFIYLWRKEGTDTASPGKWRGGAGIHYALVPHNVPSISVSFLGSGKYADRSQSLDGAYPPSLGDQGPAGIFRIDGLRSLFRGGVKPDDVKEIKLLQESRGGEFRSVQPSQASTAVGDDEIVISLCGGGGGVGDPLGRDPQRVLEDFKNHIFSSEMLRKIFGVIVDPVTRALNQRATDVEREKIRARRKERGRIWSESGSGNSSSYESGLNGINDAPTTFNFPVGNSDTALRIHYYLDIDKTGRIKCRDCGTIICNASENYKKFVPRAEVWPDELPGLRSSRDESFTLYYEYYCPGCFTLLDVEVAEKDSPPLWDIQIKITNQSRL